MASTRAVVHGLAGAFGGLALVLQPIGPATASADATDVAYAAPDPDPFYSTPGNIGDYEPGDVIDSRPMPAVVSLPGIAATLVKFRSNDSHGNPIAATTTVLTPPNHTAGAPLISYQAFINSLGAQCAISHSIYNGDPANGVRELPTFNVWLQRGFTVALPDHLGPDLAYGAARLGGQITLDGIRAVQRLPQLGLAGSPTVMAGYSGGGMTTAWAAAMQPTYAPELHLAGAAIGGAPENMEEMLRGIGTGPNEALGLAMAAAVGLDREYPDRMHLASVLNPNGRSAMSEMANACMGQLIALGAWHSIPEYTSSSLIDDQDVIGVLRDNSLDFYDGIPSTPIFEWHSPFDPLLPIDAIQRTNGRWCAAGNPVLSLQLPIPEHLVTFAAGFPEAMGWIESRLNGTPAPSNC
ncbi:lipase family protein [Nocardia stercoris]|uniref:Lipase n=1 Tax=Nocardia stercoris TaxID=2483361 RepID=A0A3M2L114_9NOCA|nr:lipase family protein [Nocardia stercoris]RMI31429.1 lipase [Nocardia stercoris]